MKIQNIAVFPLVSERPALKVGRPIHPSWWGYEYWHPAPYVSGILKAPLLLNADGMLPVPDGPGLGVEIDEVALRARGKNSDSYS